MVTASARKVDPRFEYRKSEKNGRSPPYKNAVLVWIQTKETTKTPKYVLVSANNCLIIRYLLQLDRFIEIKFAGAAEKFGLFVGLKTHSFIIKLIYKDRMEQFQVQYMHSYYCTELEFFKNLWGLGTE